MENRITTVVFEEGERVAFASPLYQYDYGQVLVIEGLELPDTFEVHFSNEQSGVATTSIYADGSVTIPDMYLTTGGQIYAWAFLHDTADDGETEYRILIPVEARASVSDEPPTPEEQSAITQAIAALNEAVSDCEEAVSHYPKIDSETGNWNTWDGEEEAWSDTGVHAQGEQGEPGTPGADGQDGFSPIATVTKSGSVATITITDKNGTTTAEVSDGDASDKMDKVNPTGTGSLSVGSSTSATGGSSTALGDSTTASGSYSHAEGYWSSASGLGSHAEGQSGASNDFAHSEGYLTEATGQYSHAEGEHSRATNDSAHAEGYLTEASGQFSHAEGRDTTASGQTSHAQGYGTTAKGINQFAFGKYNVVDNNNTYVEIVGNGTADNARSNARTLDWSGNEWLAGKLTIAGTPTGNNDVVRMIDIAGKQDTLTAGDRISISNNVISASLPWTDVSGTLTAGNTTLTLSDASITTSSTIEVFCDVDGIAEPSKAVSTGSITLTFAEAQASNMGVKVRVS